MISSTASAVGGGGCGGGTGTGSGASSMSSTAQPNYCTVSSCDNGGTCYSNPSSGTGITCVCSPVYTGSTCQFFANVPETVRTCELKIGFTASSPVGQHPTLANANTALRSITNAFNYPNALFSVASIIPYADGSVDVWFNIDCGNTNTTVSTLIITDLHTRISEHTPQVAALGISYAVSASGSTEKPPPISIPFVPTTFVSALMEALPVLISLIAIFIICVIVFLVCRRKHPDARTSEVPLLVLTIIVAITDISFVVSLASDSFQQTNLYVGVASLTATAVVNALSMSSIIFHELWLPPFYRWLELPGSTACVGLLSVAGLLATSNLRMLDSQFAGWRIFCAPLSKRAQRWITISGLTTNLVQNIPMLITQWRAGTSGQGLTEQQTIAVVASAISLISGVSRRLLSACQLYVGDKMAAQSAVTGVKGDDTFGIGTAETSPTAKSAVEIAALKAKTGVVSSGMASADDDTGTATAAGVKPAVDSTASKYYETPQTGNTKPTFAVQMGTAGANPKMLPAAARAPSITTTALPSSGSSPTPTAALTTLATPTSPSVPTSIASPSTGNVNLQPGTTITLTVNANNELQIVANPNPSTSGPRGAASSPAPAPSASAVHTHTGTAPSGSGGARAPSCCGGPTLATVNEGGAPQNETQSIPPGPSGPGSSLFVMAPAMAMAPPNPIPPPYLHRAMSNRFVALGGSIASTSSGGGSSGGGIGPAAPPSGLPTVIESPLHNDTSSSHHQTPSSRRTTRYI